MKMLKETFINNVMALSQIYGWKEDILRQACIDCNLDPYYYHVWFDKGVEDVVDFLENRFDEEALQKSYATTTDRLVDKINAILQTRVIDVSYYNFPFKPFYIKYMWRTVDRIWQHVGCKSTDFNYYTKRALLSSIYLGSRKYCACDTSENFIKTRDFIESSLNQVISTTKCIKNIPRILRKIPFLRVFI